MINSNDKKFYEENLNFFVKNPEIAKEISNIDNVEYKIIDAFIKISNDLKLNDFYTEHKIMFDKNENLYNEIIKHPEILKEYDG